MVLLVPHMYMMVRDLKKVQWIMQSHSMSTKFILLADASICCLGSTVLYHFLVLLGDDRS